MAARKACLDVCAYFILGLPGSDAASDLAGVEWARQLGIRHHAAYLIPYCGTDVVKQITEHGGKVVEDYRGALFFGQGAHPIVEYVNYSREEMTRNYEAFRLRQ